MRIPFLLLGVLTYADIFACTPIVQPPYDAASYYAGTADLSGDMLKTALNAIIRGHQEYSYSPCTWVMLEEADEDPNNPNNVIGIYTRRSIPKADRDQGGNTPDNWNREHTWPNSHGFPDRNQHAYRDGHMLRASDKSVNADRGDDDFAEGGSPHHECAGCNVGPGTWEPPDEVKGDIARSMFYMATRYEGGDASSTPDLELVDSLTSSGQARMSKLCEMVQWHLDDPVSVAEAGRNDVIYRWQGNRNPYIDHPEFVLPIWGDTCGIAAAVIEEEDVPLPLWSLVLLGALLPLLARVRR